jgi:hypothetical protein
MLRIDPNIACPDDLLDRLKAAHWELDDEESRRFDARLILLLANHIGDACVIEEAIDRARAAGARR